MSLVILLLIWVTFVVFMPSTLASIGSEFSPSMSADKKWERYSQMREEIWDKYNYVAWSDAVDRKTLTAKSAFFTENAEMAESLDQEYLASKITQVQHARSITRVSPATLLQHLLESFAGTGFERHLQFVDNVERYAGNIVNLLLTLIDRIRRVSILLVFVKV